MGGKQETVVLYFNTPMGRYRYVALRLKSAADL